MPAKKSDYSLRFWKSMADIWFAVTVLVFMLHFFSNGIYSTASSFVNILYPAVLTVYVGQKEFSRWKSKKFSSVFKGEYIVVFWTIFLSLLVVLTMVSRGAFTMSIEMVTTYLAVLSIYAVSQKSKELRTQR